MYVSIHFTSTLVLEEKKSRKGYKVDVRHEHSRIYKADNMLRLENYDWSPMINIKNPIDMATVLCNIKPNAISTQQLQNNWKEVDCIYHHIATGVPEIRRINELKDGLNGFTGKCSLVANKHHSSSIAMGLESSKNADWLKLCPRKDHTTRTFSLFSSPVGDPAGVCGQMDLWRDSPLWLWGLWISPLLLPSHSTPPDWNHKLL